MRGFRLPEQQSYEDTMRFLVHDAFPAILETNVRHSAVLPQIGIYRHVNTNIVSFMDALRSTTSREFTLSGIGSLIDYEQYGHVLKAPTTPYMATAGCSGTSLCLEPTCFGFTEGVIESNNLLRDFCWELSMPCLKDGFYSDRMFMTKIKKYFAMFFKQGPAVLQAYQRTRLIKDAIKVVAIDGNIRYTGSVLGGTSGISLPFFIHPSEPTAMPVVADLPYDIGGFNMKAFSHFLAPRFFAGGFDGGLESVTVYGQTSDYETAKAQTAEAQDWTKNDILRSLGESQLNNILGTFVHDGLFPTFKENEDGDVELVPFEILEPSTIAGFVQTSNPEHALSEIRALLLVPSNYRFTLVEPPKDDFSDIGLGESLNFGTRTPGVEPIMSSSLFRNNAIGSEGTVILGNVANADGMMVRTARGVQGRAEPIKEAIRTEVMLTYSSAECNTAAGQLPNVGRPTVAQKRADGFALKSTMYVASDVRGTARPVLVFFKTDTPRSAKPISVCSSTDVEVTSVGSLKIVDACPAGQIYTVLTMNKAVGSAFAVNDVAVLRTGPRGQSVAVDVTAVSGNVITVESVDNATLLNLCPGAKDDYGVQAELVKVTGTTKTSSEIMKAECETVSGDLFIELFEPITATLDDVTGTITLADGQEIDVIVVGNTAAGVFLRVENGVGEDCDFCELDCSCLVGAVFSK